MESSSMRSLFSRVSSIEKAAEVARKVPFKRVELTEEAKALPHHITSVTDPAKLNAQTPFFKCPPWAALPTFACHLHCARQGTTLPALGLHQFPFYLFGRSSICDYVLEHTSISSIHAVLVFHGEKKCFVLMDLGSTNGVRLNGTRIDRQRPVPAPVGSVIQFAFSSRKYEVRSGAPPSSKRLQESRDEAAAAKRTRLETSPLHLNAAGMTGATDVTLLQQEDTALAQPIATSTQTTPHVDVKKAEEEETKRETEDEKEAKAERHLYHLLIKHKDVRKPVSLAPRNKGDKITRSKDDAISIARAILSQHGNGSGWSLGAFVAMVRDYSECGSAKRDGDLGMVENGSYTDSFDKVAFALGHGEVSDPVETELGVHLIYRAD